MLEFYKKWLSYAGATPSCSNADLRTGDCVAIMAAMDAGSVDTIVTDPPYGLEFMGKDWDSMGHGNAQQAWHRRWADEAFRVLKPGGHIVAFGGTRTYHRLACALEDAGFEIRDSLHWMYGSGFPKSLNVGKAIDKQGGEDISWFPAWLEEHRVAAGVSRQELARHFPSKSGGTTGCIWNWEHGIRTPSATQFNRLCDLLRIPCAPLMEVERQWVADRKGVTKTFDVGATEAVGPRPPVTAPATPEAEQWEGWGTALKPAHEPIVLARKPLIGTVAANVLAHGTGALNVEGCRVGGAFVSAGGNNFDAWREGEARQDRPGRHCAPSAVTKPGRWPPNILLTHNHDCGSDGCTPGCPVAALDRQSGVSTSRIGNPRGSQQPGDGWGMTKTGDEYDDSGGASRFFPILNWDPEYDVPFLYQAKAAKKEREQGRPDDFNGKRWNTHPTVKPVALMRWLVRLVAPPGGVVLDPFMGSGTTGMAAELEGFRFIGIEQEAAYIGIAQRRVDSARGAS